LNFWEKQISRATVLAGTTDGSKELLLFYQQLLETQAEIYRYCATQIRPLSGKLQLDLPLLHPAFGSILWTVKTAGPPRLVEQAEVLKNASSEDVDQILLNYWIVPSGTNFFAKAFLQPYGQFISSLHGLTNANATSSETRCPICCGKPQLSVLQNREAGADSGNRDLMCAKCLSVWPFRRAVCAHCAEESPSQLAYFQSSTHDHVRVEACDTCKHYLKGVDLTRLGIAQPLVDEVAAASLDLWATEHGYTKIELNLVGL
jgi:FdhE protein